MFRIWWFAASILYGLLAGPAAWALDSDPVVTPHAEVRIVSETDAFTPGKPVRLGLRFKLAEGWHIYWSNPGAAGEPPTLDLTLPPGAKASGLAFPAPERIVSGPVMSYAYRGEVLLPLTVETPAGSASLPVDAKASWLICEKICVPEEGSFHLDLPAGTPAPSAVAVLFQQADARMPESSPYQASVSPDGTLLVAGEGLSAQTVADAVFLPGAWGAIDDLAAQKLSISDGRLSLALKPGETFDPKADLVGVLQIRSPAGAERFFTIDAKSASPMAGAVAEAAPARPPTALVAPAAPAMTGVSDLLPVLAFAFLGGLILNLMPCVFPILAMKAVGIARLSGHQRHLVRAHALSYTLGVLSAFSLLAAALISLRAAGGAVGWGFQFQSPVFVAAIAWLLFAIGLNLSGVFELRGGFVGAGQHLAARGGHAGSFFTGLLAVLVATPCTAPFMGAAIAAATAAPAGVTLLIFLVMGLGLAAPYALLGLWPGLARRLPKPGPWMVYLRQVLAFPMYGAAAWLIWVLSQQTGSDGVFITLVGGVLIGFASWIFGATQGHAAPGRLFGGAMAALATLSAVGLLYGLALSPPAGASVAAAGEREASFSPDRLAALRAEGRPVFVNMTAAWCVTCLVNEKVALSSDGVSQAFARRNVAYLKGDWTRPDPAITAFLREHGRDGVPLYVFYPAKGRPPVILPQILTADMVRDEIDQSGS